MHNEKSRELAAPHARTDPVTPESYNLLITLLIIGYLLNLIQERGTVLLPRNWQN
jgi:hypothetical protein